MKLSKRTITTRSRFTIYTRSWWAKTLLLLFFSALLFASCEDDFLTLGFKKEPKNFQVFYRELPVESVLFLADSIFTFNYVNFGDGLFGQAATPRMLVGDYTDVEFGKVRAEYYTQIRPSDLNKTPETGAIFDSVTLKLRLDLYNYGSDGITTQRFKIHKLTEPIDESKAYINQSPAFPYEDLPIAQTSFTINPEQFLELQKDTKADTVIASTVIDPKVGRELFQLWLTHDTTFTKFSLFKAAFPGLAIIPESGSTDKIFGFNPATSLTRLVLHYHVDTLKYDFDFYFDNVGGFSRIVADRSNTALSKLINPYNDYTPSNGMNYTQSGIGIYSKVDLTRLVSMRDSGSVAFNSVELEIPFNALYAATPPPQAVGLRLIDSDNKFRPLSKLYFSQYIATDPTANGEYRTGGQYLRSDLNSVATLTYDSATTAYRGFITNFAQALIREEEPTRRFINFALYPLSPDATKSVNRFVFDRSQIKLKVYYTKALEETTGD